MILSPVPRRGGNTQRIVQEFYIFNGIISRTHCLHCRDKIIKKGGVGVVARCENLDCVVIFVSGRLQAKRRWATSGKASVSVGNGGTLSARTGLFITAPPRWFSFTPLPPPATVSHIASYVKQKCNALPPAPPLPLPLSLTEESLRSTRGKSTRAQRMVLFPPPQHKMDLMLALLVPSPQPAATDGNISIIKLSFSEAVKTV